MDTRAERTNRINQMATQIDNAQEERAATAEGINQMSNGFRQLVCRFRA